MIVRTVHISANTGSCPFGTRRRQRLAWWSECQASVLRRTTRDICAAEFIVIRRTLVPSDSLASSRYVTGTRRFNDHSDPLSTFTIFEDPGEFMLTQFIANRRFEYLVSVSQILFTLSYATPVAADSEEHRSAIDDRFISDPRSHWFVRQIVVIVRQITSISKKTYHRTTSAQRISTNRFHDDHLQFIADALASIVRRHESIWNLGILFFFRTPSPASRVHDPNDFASICL